MINTDRRLAVAKTKLNELKEARDQMASAVDRYVYSDLIAEIETEIADYERARSGQSRTFPVESLDNLGPALIRARLAHGWTQAMLAEHLGVREQNVQRDEDRGYEAAGIAKIADILDALGYEFFGTIRPRVGGEFKPALTSDPNFSASVAFSFSGPNVQVSGGEPVNRISIWPAATPRPVSREPLEVGFPR